MALRTVIAGNVDKCRTEAEISDHAGNVVAIIYGDLDGWHTDVLDEDLYRSSADASAQVSEAKELLSHYINRSGDNPPDGLTVGQLALWLMVKDDGTCMGRNLRGMNA